MRGGPPQHVEQVLAQARAVAERERPAELAGREEPAPNSPEDVGFAPMDERTGGDGGTPGSGQAGYGGHHPVNAPSAGAPHDRPSPAPAAPPIGRCRSCPAPVYWCVTGTGTPMPVDVEPVANGNIQLSWNGERILAVYLTGDLAAVPGPKRVSHFATCKDAKAWRKR
jgi:hypothetical protein